jgi:hypothetical protein
MNKLLISLAHVARDDAPWTRSSAFMLTKEKVSVVTLNLLQIGSRLEIDADGKIVEITFWLNDSQIP